MDQRPAPPVTVEAEPGRPSDGLPADQIGRDQPVRAPARARLAVLLALAAAAGFLAATVLHEWRERARGDTDAGALSLAARVVEDAPFHDLAGLPDGPATTAIPLELRNTGPRPVALSAVELAGTGYAAEDVDGLRVDAGSTARLTLLRPVVCDELPDEPATRWPSLTVRARTEAGPRERRLRLRVDPYLLTGEAAHRACGRVPVSQALVVSASSVRFRGQVAYVQARVHNASAGEVVVRAVRAPAGLAIRLLEGGDDLALPLRLPGGDFSRPRAAHELPSPGRELLAELTVRACRQIPAADDGALVEVELEDAEGSTGTAHLGDPHAVLEHLRSACRAGRQAPAAR